MSSAPAAAHFTNKRAGFYRPELDVLRFGAFLFVFLHHAMPHAAADYIAAGFSDHAASLVAAIARSGELGVDVFFALSAYLITESLLRERQARGSVDIRSFYIRRILRIWPLYYAAVLILTPAMSRVAGEHMPRSYSAAFALFGGNWACALWGYPPSSLALLWSVSIEDQFYLVWPWLVRLGPAGLRRISYGMLGIACAARLALLIRGVHHPGIWCNTLARLDPFAAGALLACFLNGSVREYQTHWRLLCVGSGVVVLICCGAGGNNVGWPVLLTYPLAAGASVMTIAGVLGARCLTGSYLGKISYGLYVFHAAVIRIVPSPLFALPLTIAIAALSYRHLESPFLRLKDRFARL